MQRVPASSLFFRIHYIVVYEDAVPIQLNAGTDPDDSLIYLTGKALVDNECATGRQPSSASLHKLTGRIINICQEGMVLLAISYHLIQSALEVFLYDCPIAVEHICVVH